MTKFIARLTLFLVAILVGLSIAKAEEVKYRVDVENVQLYNGNDLNKLCSLENDYLSSSCGSYIIGSVDTLLYAKKVCIPEKVTSEQIIDVVTKFLKENPSLRHYSTPSVIALAIQTVWSC